MILAEWTRRQVSHMIEQIMKRLVVVCLSLIVASQLYAQSDKLAAPYVSSIRTSVEGSYVKLLWQDSDLAGATYIVYRSTSEITSSTFTSAQKLAEVPAGQQSYVDQPPTGSSFYYAVLVKDKDGLLHQLFIPFRNITTSAVTAARQEDSGYAVIADLKARLNGEQVDLSFTSSMAGHDLLVYRSTSPIRTPQDLAVAVTVGDISSSENAYTDTPVPGIPYYYAVIDSVTLRDGNIAMKAGANSTVTPAEVPLPGAAADAITYAPKRPRPLPFLTLSSDLQTGAALPPSAAASAPATAALTPAAQTAVSSLLGTLPAPVQPDLAVSVLDPEKGVAVATGEESSLKAIVDGPLLQRKWSDAQTLLLDFLNIKRSSAVEDRARFYLGQTYYFQGDMRRAFLEFLIAEEGLYKQVQPWMNAVFDRLHAAGS